MTGRIFKSVFAAVLMSAAGGYSCPAISAPPLSAYGELPGLERAAISPSGNRIAFVATLKDVRTLVMMENEKVIRQLALGDIKVRDIEWASDEALLLDFSQTERLIDFTADKAEFYRTFVIGTGTETPALVFGKQKEIADATFGWHGIREIEGKTFGFFGGVPMAKSNFGSNVDKYVFEGGSPALYRVDLSDLSTKQIAGRPGEGELHDYLIDANGTLAAKLVFAENKGNWKILNAKGDTITTGINKMGGIALVAFGANGSSVIFRREDEETQERRYFEVPMGGGEAKEILSDVDADRLFIDRRTGVLMGYLESGADGKTQFFDVARHKTVGRIAKAFPKVKRQLADWNPAMTKVLVTTNGNSDSGTWWTVDLLAHAASPIGFERPAITPSDVGPISTIAYKAADGMEMDGILTLPAGKTAKNLPVILMPHGGPTSHDEAVFDWWAQALSARGYAVFQPNFRGSTNRDAAFIKAGHGEWGRKMQSDISDGLAHLAAQGIVDPKRACIVGASYGGYAALAGVTLQKGLYRCAVSVAGVSDLPMMISTDISESGNNPVLKRNLIAEIGPGRELKDVSPRRFAANADAPILLIHGKDDVVVPYRQSTVMADALKDAKKPFELVTLDGEDHWLSKSATRHRMLEAMTAFVEKHNPPQ